MKEKITLKVVRELTKGYCHLVVPVRLLIPEEILYDVIRVYQYGIMTFNTSKVFEVEIVDRLLESSVKNWSSSRKEELMRCLIVSYKYMQDPCPGKIILKKDIIRLLQHGRLLYNRLFSLSEYEKDDIFAFIHSNNTRIEEMSVMVDTSNIFTDTNDPLTRLIKGLYHLTKWNKLE